MFEIAQQGMTLRWPEDTSPADSKVLVEAGPVSPTHMLNLLYTVNGGPTRATRGWPVGINPDNGLQIFAARLPDTPAGAVLNWWPVLSNGRHKLTPGPKTQPAAPKQPTLHPETGGAPFPYKMEYLARVTAPLAKTPTMIGDTPEGLMIAFPLGADGTVRGPKLNGKIDHIGGDWMRVRPDGVGISQIRVVVACDDGTSFMGEYGGVVNFGPDGYAALSQGGGPKMAEVQLAPRFISADTKLDWLNRVQCVGLGRVTMDELLVEYDLYAARSLATAKSGDPDV